MLLFPLLLLFLLMFSLSHILSHSAGKHRLSSFIGLLTMKCFKRLRETEILLILKTRLISVYIFSACEPLMGVFFITAIWFEIHESLKQRFFLLSCSKVNILQSLSWELKANC